MKKIILSIALLSAPLITSANNFSMPGFNNGNGFNNGSSWNMPNMNWGSGNNGFNNGSNWSMPTMNWSNGNNGANNWGGNNWNMPTMNWGNSNFGNNLGSNFGYNNGSNWNMPNMNWGNSSNSNNANGSNWSMPAMNWGNGSNNYAPNVQYRAPKMPVAPQFAPRQVAPTPANVQTPVFQKPIVKATTAPTVKITKEAMINRIPMPSEVKGTILAPVNKTIIIEETKK